MAVLLFVMIFSCIVLRENSSLRQSRQGGSNYALLAKPAGSTAVSFAWGQQTDRGLALLRQENFFLLFRPREQKNGGKNQQHADKAGKGGQFLEKEEAE